MITLAAITLLIWYTAKLDFVHIEKGHEIDHDIRFLQRASIGLLLLLTNFLTGLTFITLFWALFDGMLSKQKGLDFFYIEKTNSTNKYFQDKPKLYKTTKYIAFSIALILTYL